MDVSALSLVTPFLKEFPMEIYHEILKFCGPSSLANTSRVSLAFLELSSPLLYRDVKLAGFEQMQKLFCDRTSSQPLVEHHLSLHQIRTCTIFLPKSIDLFVSFSQDRSSSQPLEVDELSVRITEHTLFPLGFFNPSSANFTTIPPPIFPRVVDFRGTNRAVERLHLRHIQWPRLSRLLLRNCSLLLGSSSQPTNNLGSLSTRQTPRNKLQIIFEVTDVDTAERPITGRREREDGVENIVKELSRWLRRSRAVREVVVRVVGEEEEYMERELVIRMGKEEVERLKIEQKLRFEIWEEWNISSTL